MSRNPRRHVTSRSNLNSQAANQDSLDSIDNLYAIGKLQAGRRGFYHAPRRTRPWVYRTALVKASELPDFPVKEALPALGEALAKRTGALLEAPPGAGKSTLVPLVLLDATCLTRMLQEDSSLAESGCVIFDEFPERSLNRQGFEVLRHGRKPQDFRRLYFGWMQLWRVGKD